VSAQPLAAEAASLIEKETEVKMNIEHRTSNIERRMGKDGEMPLQYSVREIKMVGQLLNG
jgi:hypothetical protein